MISSRADWSPPAIRPASSSSEGSWGSTFNDPPTQAFVTVIEHGRLSRGHGPLGYFELDQGAAAGQGRHGRFGPGMAGADLHPGGARTFRGLVGHPRYGP